MIRSVILLLASTLLVSEGQIFLHYLILQRIVGREHVFFSSLRSFDTVFMFLKYYLSSDR